MKVCSISSLIQVVIHGGQIVRLWWSHRLQELLLKCHLYLHDQIQQAHSVYHVKKDPLAFEVGKLIVRKFRFFVFRKILIARFGRNFIIKAEQHNFDT